MVMVPAAAVNAAVVAAEATVTEGGTVRAALLLVRFTTAPLPGAARFRTRVQVDEPPLLSAMGLQVIELTSSGGTRLSNTLCDEPFRVAVTVAL